MTPFWKRTEEPTAYRLGLKNGVLLSAAVIAAAAYVTVVALAYNATRLEPPHAMGAPVRAPAGVFVLTAQNVTRVTGDGSIWLPYRGLEKVVHVDVWRLDAASAQPVWRKRLLTESAGNVSEIALLGADEDRLLVFMHGPHVVSIESGEALAGVKAIEARNAHLGGRVPMQAASYRFFDGSGLAFTGLDGRPWLLDAQTLSAVPWRGAGPIARETAVGPLHFSATDSKTFQKRGITQGHHWLGLLTDDEASALKSQAAAQQRGASVAFIEYMRAAPDLSHAGSNRYRLWQTKIEEVSAAPPGWPKSLPYNWGTRPRYADFVLLEKTPQLLQAGLLTDGRSTTPLLLTAPDSVLVLHHDRVDDGGHLRIARVAAADGRVLWDAALPLSVLQSVMPGADSFVLYGRAYAPDRPRGAADPYVTAHDWIVSLNLKDGATRSFDLSYNDSTCRGACP